MKTLLNLIVAILIFTSAPAQKKKSDIESLLKGVDKELKEVLDTWKAAGFAVAVVEKDKIVYASGFGYRDYENKKPVTPNTLFAIGSCTKAFTAALLGQLEGDGEVDLGENPRKYIPELEFFNSEMNTGITIRDMMSHRTGLPRHDFSWFFFPSNSKDSLLMRVKHQEPFMELREGWYYNNFMYLAQGVIAERITGKSWEEGISERFFSPLQMMRSNLSIDELELSEDISLGYQLKEDKIIEKMDYYHIAGMSPAGSINSSVNEMANWLITWIHGGTFKGKQVIPESFARGAISSQMVIGAGMPTKENPDLFFSNYGYGWFLSSYKGHYRVEHGGNINGFSASTSFFPTDSIGIVVLVNQNGSAVPAVVRNIISDRVLNVEHTDWNKELFDRRRKAMEEQEQAQTDKGSGKKKGTSISHELNEFTGTYSNPGYGDLEVIVERDSLFAMFPLTKYWLKHYHFDIFEPIEVRAAGIDTTDQSPLRLNFRTGNVGDISGADIQIEPMLEAIFFKRIPQIIDLDKDVLDMYVGEYEIGGTVAKVYKKGDDELYLFIEGQPEYELLATDHHKFSIKVLGGYFVEFLEEEDGKITGLLFIQPNGTFKAQKK